MKHNAAPYALALLEIAQETNDAERIGKQLFDVKEVVDSQRELNLILKHPKIDAETKAGLLGEIFESSADPLIMHFLQVVCRNNMAGALSEMADDYQRLYDESRNIKSVKVTSACRLDDDQFKALKEMLEKKLNGPVRMDVKVDPALIAGLRIQADGLSMDNSFASRLNSMNEALHRH
ncbi:MAG: ATP synthase F1 subunit delta [Erysipelotrichaceae bacterium]|nr:ATP synthase F1 subunit delta [Erysipelotrichaceae bacterium]